MLQHAQGINLEMFQIFWRLTEMDGYSEAWTPVRKAAGTRQGQNHSGAGRLLPRLFLLAGLALVPANCRLCTHIL